MNPRPILDAATLEQPSPRYGTDTPAYQIATRILEARAEVGVERYGDVLHVDDTGRDALVDAIQEAADCLVYLVQAWCQRKTERAELARLRGEVERLKAIEDRHIRAIVAYVSRHKADHDDSPEWRALHDLSIPF